ncbi:MAG: TrmB family transcriptional regulator [Candidatus Hadarchaeaceae archaeon]
MSIVEQLQNVGLTQYEAKVYSSLLNDHLNSATKLSEKSGVPRTKIYSVLESLQNKGWVKIYSGAPLLFKPVRPDEIFEKMKRGYVDLLKTVNEMLEKEMVGMEKFVIQNYDVGLHSLKEQMKKAKTVWISNATTEFLKKVSGAFSKDAEIKVVLFPGEKKIAGPNIQSKEAGVRVVSLVRGKETPSTTVILDEERVFTTFKDPVKNQYTVSEFLYDECNQCFRGWFNLGWGQ